MHIISTVTCPNFTSNPNFARAFYGTLCKYRLKVKRSV